MPPKGQLKKKGIFTLADLPKSKPVKKSTGGSSLNDLYAKVMDTRNDKALDMTPNMKKQKKPKNPVPVDEGSNDDEEYEYADPELDADDLELIGESVEEVEQEGAEECEEGEKDSEDGDTEVDSDEQEKCARKDDRFLTNKKRLIKNYFHIAARAEADGRKWKNKPDEELGDIIPEETGGRYRLVPDPKGSILLDENDNTTYYDENTRQKFRLSQAHLKGLSGSERQQDKKKGVLVVATRADKTQVDKDYDDAVGEDDD